MKTVIFDLDGTLADVSHRRRFKEGGCFDWKYFNDPENIKRDPPNRPIVELYTKLKGQYELVIFTGRMGNINDTKGVGKETRRWLEDHLEICAGQTIVMRRDLDFREDWIIKEEMLLAYLEYGQPVAFAVDDRQQVVDMWRRNGITCLQCAPGNF